MIFRCQFKVLISLLGINDTSDAAYVFRFLFMSPFISPLELRLIDCLSFMSLSVLCRHKRSSMRRESVVGEDKEVQPGEGEVEMSSVRHDAQPAQHKDRRLSLQIHSL